MKFFERLKTIGISLPKLESFSFLNFSLNIDRSIHADGATLIVNPDKLSGKQKRGLKQLLREHGLSDGGAIVETRSAKTVEEVLEVLPEIEDQSKLLRQIIPPEDIPLLNACLFLRERFKKGACVEGLKSQIMRVYGMRGGNFANLCSTGYLETWFLPFYEELQRSDPLEAKAKFQTHYRAIVNELPWTEFVSIRSNRKKVTGEIIEKMKLNLQNGVRHMNIHGLGPENVKKVRSILPEVQKQTGAEAVRIEQDNTHIFVRLEVPASK
ncbi:MAG: hypothetical protein WA117_11650 [Verrucomicrobiia bacterium]